MIFHEAGRREARPIPTLRDDRGQPARAFCRRKLDAAGQHVRRPPPAEVRPVRRLRGALPHATVHLRPGSRNGLRHGDPAPGIERPRPAAASSAGDAAWPLLDPAAPPALQEVPA